MTDMVRYSIRWSNPRTSPPDGENRVKAAVLVERGMPCPQEIKDLHIPGDGWAISWELISQSPIRRWSRETKARVRQRNLRLRMEKKFPLFAEIFIAEELAKRPSYFEAADA